MTDLCTIGPVSITDAHLFDNNSFQFSSGAQRIATSGNTIVTKGQFQEEYSFQVLCTADEALQLKGVVEQGEIIWIDTSSDLTDNNFMQHKGWVILTSLDIEHMSPTIITCTIGYIKISDHSDEYLTLDYSRGVYDGINLDPTYDITSQVFQLQEDGSDATTNWSTIREYPTAATTSWATDGSEWDMANASGTDGTWANAWVICDTATFTPPFTFETILDYNSLPGAASYPASLGVMFSPNNVASGDIEFVNKKLGDYLEVQWNLTNTATNMHIAEIKPGTTYGTATFMKSGINLGTTYAECGLKIIFYADGKIRVYTDLDTTGTWTQQYYGPSNLVNYNKGLYLYFMVKNRDSTSFTGSFQQAYVYNEDDVAFPNIVCAPYNATLTTAATGHRHGEDGDIYYYTNPTTELRYLIAKADYYKGSVKLLSTNNSATSSRQVFGTDINLTPTTTTLKNGFTQLTFDADEVIISAWDSAAWNEVNRIHFTADIDFIRPLFVSPDRVVLQINSTKWTMLRSSPVVTVEHPDEVLGYTRRDRYNLASGLISGPAADADITMTANTDYYCPIYDNASDTYQLLICLKDPATIKSDSIPVSSPTVGIGWFKKGNTGVDAAASLAQQWYKQTRTGISLKQII